VVPAEGGEIEEEGEKEDEEEEEEEENEAETKKVMREKLKNTYEVVQSEQK
jgi:hypothetical protein